MADTAIEWTDATWNPSTGCDKVSPGCDHCYALTMAGRLKAMGQAKYQTDGDPRTSGPGFGVAVHEDALLSPLGWYRPRRVFVNSMSDLFHARVPRWFVARVFAVMAMTPQHTYQILTKRPRRMVRMIGNEPFMVSTWKARGDLAGIGSMNSWPRTPNSSAWPLPNVWLGTSVEDQERADERIPDLLATPAAVRFLSCEPLLGPIDLGIGDPHAGHDYDDLGGYQYLCLTCSTEDSEVEYFRREPGGNGIDWVIVGGESGKDARPMHPDWARSLRDQCQQARVPFFFKQWGGKTPKAGGRELDGRTWDEYPAGVA